MISISGIKYQKELEALPYFNKKTAALLIGKRGKNLDKKIQRLISKNYFFSLKKGWYATSIYSDKLVDKQLYLEYLANILRFPSYISLEYALSAYGLIPQQIKTITSITFKTNRIFENRLGTFIYRNIKQELFSGFLRKDFSGKKIYFATRPKALFDFLYLKKLNSIKQEIAFDLRINWTNFTTSDLKKFERYVLKSRSLKMNNILKNVKEAVNAN